MALPRRLSSSRGDTLRVLDPLVVDSGATIAAGPAGNRQTIVLSVNPGAVDPGNTNPNLTALAINRDETADQLASRIAALFVQQGVDVTTLGPQIRFADGSGLEVTAMAGLAQTGQVGVSPGNQPIGLNLDDTAADLAARVAAAVTAVVPTSNPTINAGGNGVTFNAAVSAPTSANGGLRRGGGRLGGSVTGIETIGGNLYAVTNAGELYLVPASELNANRAGNRRQNVAVPVESATDLTSFTFSSLRRGPANITGPDGQPLSNLLFGTTIGGRLVAFNTAGVLQPVFAGGLSSIQVGGGSIVGLDFSTLDFNLFHVTNRRSGDEGHGVPGIRSGLEPNSDAVQRVEVSGGNSIAFSFETNAFNNRFPGGERPVIVAGDGSISNPRQDGQLIANTLNFPGGASGAIQSNPFSLAGYAAEDQPYLYFSYFLDTDVVENQDTIRVFVVDSVGARRWWRPTTWTPATISGPTMVSWAPGTTNSGWARCSPGAMASRNRSLTTPERGARLACRWVNSPARRV